MGFTSEYAEGLLIQQTNGRPDMAGQLAVQLNDGTFITEYVTYGSGLTAHVEDRLLHWLEEKFGALDRIPENSKIIFYGHWSPCSYCMSHAIPQGLRGMDIKNRNQRVRFRFNRYYTNSEWSNADKGLRQGSVGHFFWDSNEAAEAAYANLAQEFGNFPMKSRSTESQVATSISPRVAFIRGLSSSRTTTNWGESWRGKIFSGGSLVT